MPHQCVRCNNLYEDGSDQILKGCSCGGRLFFYIKKDKLERIRKVTANLTTKEKDQIEADIFDIIGSAPDDAEPIVLDLEAIRVLKPGKFEIDLVHLFKNDPLVYKVGEGKYIIDLVKSFRGREND